MIRNDDYTKYNRSTWYLLPLLLEDKKTYRDFLFQSNLFNTYIRGLEYDLTLSRPLYIHYKWQDTAEFKYLEEYLTLDLNNNQYIDTIERGIHEVIIVYNITDEKCVIEYDKVLEGNYSKLSVDYMLKILEFFFDGLYIVDSFIHLLFKKDPILWHTRRRELGCMKDKCNCSVKITASKNSDGNDVVSATKDQPYEKCKFWEKWEMPKGVELESKLEMDKETLI